nr:uncharacterized protein LOC111984958 [Quercus suber]
MGVKPKFEEILGFRSQIEDLERRAWELEKQFVSYCDLKEQESLLTELKNMVLLEIAHVEFLDREISSAEAENERLRNLVVQYVGVLEYIEHWKSKNGSLQRKVKRLLRRTKQQSRVKRDQNMKIEATEAEILRNCDGLETRFNVIKKLEEEVRELHKIMVQMREENNELLNKLELIEGEVIAMENYNELGNEPEQLQKDRAAELRLLKRVVDMLVPKGESYFKGLEDGWKAVVRQEGN